jgi:PKD domain/PQQ-like domain
MKAPTIGSVGLLLSLPLLGIGCSDSSSPIPESASDTDEISAAVVPPQQFRIKWRLKLDGDYSLHTPGVGADGTVYVSVSSGKLYAVAPGGTVRWIFFAGNGGGAVDGPVSVGPDGTIYVAGAVLDPGGNGSTGAIHALTTAGAVKWTFKNTGQLIMGGPNVGPDGNIYAVTSLGGIGLFSLTPAGVLRFNVPGFSERGGLGTSIAFGPNQMYFAFDGTGVTQPSLFSYTLNGAKRFQAPNSHNNARPVAGPNGNVVVETFPGNVGLGLTAYSPAGALLWNFSSFNTLEHADVGPDNFVYSVRNLSTLFSLTPAGAERWKFVDTTIMFEPRVRPQNDLLFMGGRITYGQPGFFQAVSTGGTPLWRVNLPTEPGFAPYGQLVPMTRPVFSPDGNTGYGVTDVAGDGSNAFSYLYAIDLGAGSGGSNRAPAVTLTATTATTINKGNSVTFRGSFTDPDAGDGPWTVRWKFGNGSVTTTKSSPGGVTRTRTYGTVGDYSVTLTVTDARGAMTTSTPIVVRVR